MKSEKEFIVRVELQRKAAHSIFRFGCAQKIRGSFFFNVEKFVEYFIECFIYFFVVVAVYSLSCLQSQRLALPQLYVMTAKASA